ncbi:MAG: NB-ARC domain-containing protein [Methylococcales bacterium]
MSDINTQTNIYGNIEKYIQIGCVYGNVYFQKDKVFPQVLTAYPKPSLSNIINREEELVEFHEIFKNKNFISITGFGGIGKTTFAGLYREKYINEYEHLVWINCISNEKVDDPNYSIAKYFYDQQLRDNLGVIFENPTIDSNFYNEALGIIINRLNEIKNNSLLVIDNANYEIDQNDIYNRLSALNSNWKILITTRENLSLHFQMYELNFLLLEQARELFYLYYKREHNNALVDEIVQIVGLHTLTIELLAKTVQANRSLNLESLKELLSS